MNFLNFLTSGAGLFNFNLQNLSMNTNSNGLPRPTSFSNYQNKNQLQELEEKPVSSAQVSNPNNEIQNVILNKQTELFTHHQQLINQYMHLNLQLLSQKIENLENNPEKKQQIEIQQLRNNKKKIKKMNVNCGHNDRQHYAKGMCNNCYHKNGRTKKPWKCNHEKLYANGLCQNCYINKYNKMKREKNTPQDFSNMQNFDFEESKLGDLQAKAEEI